jgi:hypothetical protein
LSDGDIPNQKRAFGFLFIAIAIAIFGATLFGELSFYSGSSNYYSTVWIFTFVTIMGISIYKLRYLLGLIRNRMKTSIKWPTYVKIINGLCWAGPFLLIPVFHSLYPYLILIGIGIGNISTYLFLRIYSKNDNKEQLLVGFLSMCMAPTLLLFSTTLFSNRPDIVLILSRLLIGVSYGLGGIYAIFTK